MASVLEYIPLHSKKIKELSIHSTTLTSSILHFCKNKDSKCFLVSLSGGVDSMVLITILHYFNIDIVAVHINYNNREESNEEQRFLEQWCDYNNITLHVKTIDHLKRHEIKRSDYEILTKNIRIDFYKEIMKLYHIECVLLAHHKDDIVENIFANVCRGRNLLDLAVIKQDTMINNINIGRPMTEFYKNAIYDFAHMYQVPYFKDTTPDWSVRGKYRKHIYPAVEDAFTNNVKKNIIHMSNQSNEWNMLIMKEILSPFMEQVCINENVVTFNVTKYINYPMCFWNVIFMNIFNKHGYKCPSKKSIQAFLNTIQDLNTTRNITLSNICKCTLLNSNITISFL